MIWQLADSGFPGGGFAHSSGLEAAVQSGLITDEASLADAVLLIAHQTAGAALPAVYSVIRQPDAFAKADRRVDAAMLNQVARRASVAQGQALLTAAGNIFNDLPDLLTWIDEVRRLSLPKHLAPVFGRLTGELGLTCPEAGRLMLFMSARSAMSAAVRLGACGAMQSQRLLRGLAEPCDEIVERSLEWGLDDIHQAAPLLDLLQSGQDRLYSRLFQS